MKAKKPKTVLDLYRWLPGYGENKIFLHYSSDLKLILKINFDSSDSDDEKKLKIEFLNVSSFNCSSFPGADVNFFEYEKGESISNLIEFQNSDIANEWSKKMSFIGKIRHFRIFFTSENKILEVFATDFSVVDGEQIH